MDHKDAKAAKESVSAVNPGTNAGAAVTSGSSSGGSPFKRTLTVKDMVIYGLISMVPIAPMAIYGSVFQTSDGMPALAYLIGFLAVLFSVFSFGIMIQRFPSSGSIFTYSSSIMGKGMGFLTGWLMLLQYLVTPALMYIIAATALHGIIPAIPAWLWCMIFLAIVAVISMTGMKATVTVNRFALIGELIVLGLFIGFGLAYMGSHPTTSGASITAFIDPSKINGQHLMNAVSLAVLSYVGFGCIATLTQEAENERKGPPKAMMIMALILVVLFCLQCYIATCIDPTGKGFTKDPDHGFYLVAGEAGGAWLSVACAVAVALSQGIFTALVSQTSVSLIMYTMAKGGTLPGKLGEFNTKKNSPVFANVVVLIISLALTLIMLPLGVSTVAKVSNFGALATYSILNICVIVYCWVQQKEHKNVFRHLIFPALGAIICLIILVSLNDIALIVGCIWTVLGIVYYLVIKNVLHKKITL